VNRITSDGKGEIYSLHMGDTKKKSDRPFLDSPLSANQISTKPLYHYIGYHFSLEDVFPK
jgi:hypothetical protein